MTAGPGGRSSFREAPLSPPRARHALAGLQTLLSLKLRSVAQRFGVSASRISHIQRALEQASPSPEHRKAMALCKVKQRPALYSFMSETERFQVNGVDIDGIASFGDW